MLFLLAILWNSTLEMYPSRSLSNTFQARSTWQVHGSSGLTDGQSGSSYMTLKPFAVLFWALAALYLPACCTVSFSLYGHADCMAVGSWFNSHKPRVASFSI